MIGTMIAAGTALLCFLPERCEPPLHAEIVVLTTGFPGGPLADETRRLLSALEEEGRLRLGLPTVAPDDLRRCLGEDPEPSNERSACIRAAVPSDAGGVPVVVIALGDTQERGSWQRMQCIGPRSEGFRRTIYIRDFDHPRPDVSTSVKEHFLGCIAEALGKG